MLYLVTNKSLYWSNKEVLGFFNVIENPIMLIDTTSPAFKRFFSLLNHIVGIKFVVNCYYELMKHENDNITFNQVGDYLRIIVSQIQNELYIAVLPSNYCALTCFNGQILLNGAHNCLFHHIEDMIK